MTPTRFRECLDAIGWSQRGVADRLGIHETRTRRMATGQYDIPANLSVWLELLAQTHEAHPAPDGWNAAKAGGKADD